MWIKNPSKVVARLVRSRVGDELALAALVVPQAYRITSSGLVPLAELPDPTPRDAPDTSLYVLWEGVSVTVAGHVEGPSKPPFVRLVRLRVGAVERSIAAIGDRVWERSILAGGLTPSEPKRFDRLELSVERAFGGAYDVPPGILPGYGLPHPGFRADHAINPKGVGFYADEKAAEGAPLPNFERPTALIQRWNDSPEPAAFSPCRDLTGWRVKAIADGYFQKHTEWTDAMSERPPPIERQLLIIHHAPPELILEDVSAGTPIELDGLSAGPVRLEVPPCAVRIAIQRRDKKMSNAKVVPEMRAIHIDADRGLVLTSHALTFRYNPKRSPHAIHVTRAEAST